MRFQVTLPFKAISSKNSINFISFLSPPTLSFLSLFYFLPFLIVLPIISNTTFNKTDGNEDYFFVSDPRDKLKSLPYE